MNLVVSPSVLLHGYGTEAELKEADAEYLCDDVDEIADVLDLEALMVRR